MARACCASTGNRHRHSPLRPWRSKNGRVVGVGRFLLFLSINRNVVMTKLLCAACRKKSSTKIAHLFVAGRASTKSCELSQNNRRRKNAAAAPAIILSRVTRCERQKLMIVNYSAESPGVANPAILRNVSALIKENVCRRSSSAIMLNNQSLTC